MRAVSPQDRNEEFDVVVVGAGAAGIGVAVALGKVGVAKLAVLDRYDVGASFERWPKHLRFLTPSFPAHGFGLLDLNAVTPRTSPGLALQTEHPSGQQYAEYLRAVAEHLHVPVARGQDVLDLQRDSRDEKMPWRVRTRDHVIRARFVVWAAGEFQYPRLNGFPGAEHCRHTSLTASWDSIGEGGHVVIGGLESGIDAALRIVELGERVRVRVVDPAEPWQYAQLDPSRALTPRTQERLRGALESGRRIRLIGGGPVQRVTPVERGYLLERTGARGLVTPNRPFLATGFSGSLSLLDSEFDRDPETSAVKLTEHDESTRSPGLFLVGPQVRHGALIFCFIYKFRQRFAVVAKEIANRLGLATDPLDEYRAAGMFLDDLSCCDDSCVC
ncbi:MAG: monooxygenase [Deltaproteobacteria bacterium]|nr:monooxygenase [Deltaproteobacteria bacterium]